MTSETAEMLDPADNAKRLAVVPCREDGYDFYLFRATAPMSTLLVPTDNGYCDVCEKDNIVIEGWGRISVPFSAQL